MMIVHLTIEVGLEYLENIGSIRDVFEDLPKSPVQGIMKSFAEMQIRGIKEKLQSGNPAREATRSLYQSISFKIGLSDKEVSIDFLMNDYWDFINKGVNGVNNSFGSPYSFKTEVPGIDMVDAFAGVGSLDGWIRAKNITQLIYTNEFGDQIVEDLVSDQDYRSAAYVFARGVKRKGIEGNFFVDKVFNEDAVTKFQNEILNQIDKMIGNGGNN